MQDNVLMVGESELRGEIPGVMVLQPNPSVRSLRWIILSSLLRCNLPVGCGRAEMNLLTASSLKCWVVSSRS